MNTHRMRSVRTMSSDAVRQIMEAIASTSDSEKTFIERIRDEGIAEGKAEDLLSVLDARGLAVTDGSGRRSPPAPTSGN